MTFIFLQHLTTEIILKILADYKCHLTDRSVESILNSP